MLCMQLREVEPRENHIDHDSVGTYVVSPRATMALKMDHPDRTKFAPTTSGNKWEQN